jgi:Ca2+-binding RTX toxin-like protein
VQGKDTQLHLLTDLGLDAESQPLLPFTQSILGRWMEENADLVTGIQGNGVAPSDGTGMVALFATGGVVSQVRQRIDVSHLADKIDKGLITAYALGRVNASDTGVVGGTQVSAMSDNSGAGPSGTLGFGKGGTRELDEDTSTWETIFSYMVLPVGTKSVEFQFLFTNESLAGGKIGYGDEAVLVLSEWSDGTETCDFDDPNAIMGTPGNDTLLGTLGDDIIFGLEGNDTIFGFGGNDCINLKKSVENRVIILSN